MEGLTLHWQLRERGARLIERTQSASSYRFYLLPSHGNIPARPAMIRVTEGGASIGLEIWEIPQSTVGSFLEGIGSPLGLGKVQLSDGRYVCGFIGERIIQDTALDITSYGDWRKWLETTQ